MSRLREKKKIPIYTVRTFLIGLALFYTYISTQFSKYHNFVNLYPILILKPAISLAMVREYLEVLQR